SAYVVESIPLAIFAASKALEIGLGKMFQTLIEIGGDTDTNCSIAGQIAGAAMGVEKIPLSLIQQLKELDDYEWIERVIGDFLEKCL
ncbi:MAG: ADP-ribosylglycohydrolase family protein, partial [Chitinophagales bacterium]